MSCMCVSGVCQRCRWEAAKGGGGARPEAQKKKRRPREGGEAPGFVHSTARRSLYLLRRPRAHEKETKPCSCFLLVEGLRVQKAARSLWLKALFTAGRAVVVLAES